jgi:uncharacterized membrane protein
MTTDDGTTTPISPAAAVPVLSPEARHENNKTLTLILYGLYGASMFTGGLSAIVAIVVNYIKREELAGTMFESHFTWQIRTFWWGLLWFVLGLVLMFVVVGFVVLFANWVWTIYRVVKGFLYVMDGKPMEVK